MQVCCVFTWFLKNSDLPNVTVRSIRRGVSRSQQAEKFTGDLDVMTVLFDRFVVVFRVHNKHRNSQVLVSF